MRKHLLLAIGVCSSLLFTGCLKQENENQAISGKSHLKTGTLYVAEELKLTDAAGIEHKKTIQYDDNTKLPTSVTTTVGGNVESTVSFNFDANSRISEITINTMGRTEKEKFAYVGDKVSVTDANNNTLRILTVTNNQVVSSTVGYDGTATTYEYNPTTGNLEKEVTELSTLTCGYDDKKAPFTDLGLVGVNEFSLSSYFQFTGREANSLKNNVTTETYSNGANVTRSIMLNTNGYPSTITINTQTSGANLLLLPQGNATMTITYKQMAGEGGGKDPIFILDESDKFATIVFTDEEFDSWLKRGFSNNEKRQDLTKKVYEEFKDDFDFIFYIVNYTYNDPTRPDNCNTNPACRDYYYPGQLIHVKNEIQGLGSGMWLFDDTDKYGSAGKLMSTMQLPNWASLRNGPSLHEFAHQWANFGVDTYDNFDNPSCGDGGCTWSAKPHWGYTSTCGQLGGFKDESFRVVDAANKIYHGDNGGNSFGTYANGGNTLKYSKLELYLMGFAPKEEVPPFKVFNGISWIPDPDVIVPPGEEPDYYSYFYNKGNFKAESYEQLTIDDVIAKNGERIPNYNNSQKNFKVLNILITSESKGLLTGTNRITFVNYITNFSAQTPDPVGYENFWSATEGRGSIDMSNLSNSLK